MILQLSNLYIAVDTTDWIRAAHWFSSGLETLLLGGACATVAFTVGHYVNDLLGEDVEGVA